MIPILNTTEILRDKGPPPSSQGTVIKTEPQSSSEAEEDEALSVCFQVNEEGGADDTFYKPGMLW